MPIKIDKSYTPGEDWIGFLLGSSEWFDISDFKMASKQYELFFDQMEKLASSAKDRVVIEGNAIANLFFLPDNLVS